MHAIRARNSSMSVTVVPLTESFAAEIGDIDLSQPVAPSDLATINEALQNTRS
jgi:hypothetical protein